MPIFPDVADRFADERIGAVGAFAGLQVVRRLEVALVHLVGIDEVEDVDRLRLLERGGLEVVLGEDDELALLVFVALDQIFPADRLPFATGRRARSAPGDSSLACSSRNFGRWSRVALYSSTGMFTSPNAIAPFHIARAMCQSLIPDPDSNPESRAPNPESESASHESRLRYLHSAATCVKLRMLSTRIGASPAGFASGLAAAADRRGARFPASPPDRPRRACPVALMVCPTWSASFSCEAAPARRRLSRGGALAARCSASSAVFFAADRPAPCSASSAWSSAVAPTEWAAASDRGAGPGLVVGVLVESKWTLVRMNEPAGSPFVRQPVTVTVLPSGGDWSFVGGAED